MKIASLIVTAALCSIIYTPDALAQNRNILPLGEKEMFLANSGAAMAGSAGGVYYNPASLGFIDSSRLAFSGTAFLGFYSNTPNFIYLDNTALPFSLSGTQSVPSTLVSTFKVGSGTMAFSILLPTSLQFNNKNSWTTPNTQIYLTDDLYQEELWVGLSYGRKITPTLSWGASLYGSRWKEILSENLLIHFPAAPNNLISTQAYLYQNVYNLSAIAGLLWQATPNWNFGVRILSPSLQLSGSVDTVSLTETVSGGTNTPTDESKDGSPSNYVIPAELTLGAHYHPSRLLRLLLDVTTQFPATYDIAPGTVMNQHIETKTQVRESLGADFAVSETTYIDTGFFYNPSSAANLKNGESLEDYMGVTAGVYYSSGRVKSGFGGFYEWSNGQNQPAGAAAPTSTINTQVYGAVISTSYTL